MSNVNRRKNNSRKNNGRKNDSNGVLNSFSKDFPDVSKMAEKVHKNFMVVANNKYFLYVMLFLGISTVLGFMSVKNYNAVIMFIVVAAAMRYFTKNVGLMMLVAVLISNIISVKSTIEGMKGQKKSKKKAVGKKEVAGKKAAAGKKAVAGKNAPAVEDDASSDEEDDEVVSKKPQNKPNTSSAAMKKLVGGKDKSGMAPIDYNMSPDADVDEDDEDMIDLQSTQQAAYDNLNNIIGDNGFSKMTQDTEKLMNQQENLAKAMESIGPLLQNAEKMMSGLNLDKFTGMLDKLNGMVGAGNNAVKGASS
jgi:hypothetical protein